MNFNETVRYIQQLIDQLQQSIHQFQQLTQQSQQSDTSSDSDPNSDTDTGSQPDTSMAQTNKARASSASLPKDSKPVRNDKWHKCARCPTRMFGRLRKAPSDKRTRESLQDHVEEVHADYDGDWEDFIGAKVLIPRKTKHIQERENAEEESEGPSVVKKPAAKKGIASKSSAKKGIAQKKIAGKWRDHFEP